MNSWNRMRRVAVAVAGWSALAVGGLVALPGCGEPEATIAPVDKPKDDLQKDIENPYGGDVKQGKPLRRR